MKRNIKKLLIMVIVTGMISNTFMHGIINATTANTDRKIEDNVREKADIVTFTDTQVPDKNNFILNPILDLPKNSTNNQLKIELPEGIRVITNPTLDDVLLDFVVTINKDRSTTILMVFKDSTTASIIGKSIELSQADFIRNSKQETYNINMTFTNNENMVSSANKTYTADTDFNTKDIVTALSGSVNGFLIFEDSAEWKLKVTTTFDFDETNNKGKLVLDAKTFEQFKLSDPSLHTDENGNFEILITEDMITKGTRELELLLPLKVDIEKIKGSIFEEYTFMIDGEISFDNGKQVGIHQSFTNTYLQLSKLSNSNNLPYLNTSLFELFNQHDKNFNSRFIIEYSYIHMGKNVELDPSAISGINEYLNNGKNGVSFKIPEYLTWDGADISGSSYDPSTKEITLLNLPNGGNIAKDKSMLLYNTRYKYDFDWESNENFKEITKENYNLSNFNMISLFEDGTAKYIPVAVDDTKSADRLSKDFQNFDTSAISIKQGKKDILLSEVRFTNQYKNFPKLVYSFDYRQEAVFQSGKKPYTDLFQIHRIEINKDYITKELRNQSLKFIYTTNKNEKESSIDMNVTPSIKLLEGEYLTSYRLTSEGVPQSSRNIKSEAVLSFYGDVGINANKQSETIKKDATLILPQASDSFAYKEREGYQAVNIVIEPDGEYDLLDKIKLNNIYPGKIESGHINFSTIPSAEGVEEVSYEYVQDNESKLRISRFYGLKVTFGEQIPWLKIQYTTKNNSELKNIILKEDDDLKLDDDDYFTSIKITRPNIKGDFNENFSVYTEWKLLYEDAPDKMISTENIEIFRVVDTPNVKGKISISYLTVEPYSILDQSALLYYNEENKITDLNTAYNIGDSVVIPMLFQVETRFNENRVALEVINPTFYIELPDDFDFQGMVFSGSLKGKLPKTTVLTRADGKRFGKVKFYGDPDGKTGLRSKTVKDEIAVEFKVRKFAKPNERIVKNLETLVDLEESLHWYKDDEKKVVTQLTTSKEPYDDGVRFIHLTEMFFYDTSVDKTVRIVRNEESTFNGISYSILQATQVVIDTNVTKEGDSPSDGSGNKEVSIRSGENYEVGIGIYNGVADGSGKPMNNFVMYVPIAQKASGSGAEWAAKLVEINSDDAKNIEYFVSTDVNPTKNELNKDGQDDKAMYELLTSTMDLSKVTMIKLKASTIKGNELIELKAKFTNAEIPEDIPEASGLKNAYKIEYAYDQGSPERIQKEIDITVNLLQTKLAGKLFIDANSNGSLDINEIGIADTEVTLIDKGGSVIKTVKTDEHGIYEFHIPGISSQTYLQVPKLKDRRLTIEDNKNVDATQRSYFDRNSRQAFPTIKNAEYLNAGFYEPEEPSYFLSIPDQLVVEENEYGSATAEVNVSLVESPSSDTSMIPIIEIFTETDLKLKQTTSEDYYMAYPYYSDGKKYENLSLPIISLAYANLKEDTFSLKVENKNTNTLGIYTGKLHVIFGYEGD